MSVALGTVALGHTEMYLSLAYGFVPDYLSTADMAATPINMHFGPLMRSPSDVFAEVSGVVHGIRVCV